MALKKRAIALGGRATAMLPHVLCAFLCAPSLNTKMRTLLVAGSSVREKTNKKHENEKQNKTKNAQNKQKQTKNKRKTK